MKKLVKFFSSNVLLCGDFGLQPFTHGGFLNSAHQGLFPFGQIEIFLSVLLGKDDSMWKNPKSTGFRKSSSET